MGAPSVRARGRGVFMQARWTGSVELNGAAVVLTVLALLLRGAHEAAQKVPWKQTQVPSGAQQLHTVSTSLPGNPTFRGAVFQGFNRLSKPPTTSLWEHSACLQGPDSWGETPSAHRGTQHSTWDSPGEVTVERTQACMSYRCTLLQASRKKSGCKFQRPHAEMVTTVAHRSCHH